MAPVDTGVEDGVDGASDPHAPRVGAAACVRHRFRAGQPADAAPIALRTPREATHLVK